MNNTITLVGYVGQNPHAISFGDTGNQVVKFSIAVKEFCAITDESRTLWLDVDAWNGLGERVLKTVTKGRELVVHGRLALSTFNKEVNGTTVEITKPVVVVPVVVVFKIELAGTIPIACNFSAVRLFIMPWFVNR